MTRLCDGAPNKPCPRKNPCEGDCHFNTAGLNPYRNWMDERQTETAWIVASWLVVAFCVFVLFGTACAMLGLL